MSLRLSSVGISPMAGKVIPKPQSPNTKPTAPLAGKVIPKPQTPKTKPNTPLAGKVLPKTKGMSKTKVALLVGAAGLAIAGVVALFKKNSNK